MKKYQLRSIVNALSFLQLVFILSRIGLLTEKEIFSIGQCIIFVIGTLIFSAIEYGFLINLIFSKKMKWK